jgi:presenilin-like A22 family membrane protease
MIKLAKDFSDKGVPLAIINPIDKGDLMSDVSTCNFSERGEGRYYMLGTGDMAFPLMFAVALLRVNIFIAIVAAISAIIGYVTAHFYMVKTDKPIPALPFITAFCLITYGLLFVL